MMMKKLLIATAMTLAAAGALAQHGHDAPPARKVHLCESCGTVQSVRMEKRKGEGGAVGVIGGAAVGGLLGNQIGKGGGNALATIGGAVAGGFAGNEVQKRVNTKEVWVTDVRMRDGKVRRFEQSARPWWKAGTVVRVEGRNLGRV